MIGRHGNVIRVAWAKHEMEWLRAALTLPLAQRMVAFHDISDLTGRSFRQVQNQGTRLRSKQKRDAATILAATPYTRRVLVPNFRPRQASNGPVGGPGFALGIIRTGSI